MAEKCKRCGHNSGVTFVLHNTEHSVPDRWIMGFIKGRDDIKAYAEACRFWVEQCELSVAFERQEEKKNG